MNKIKLLPKESWPSGLLEIPEPPEQLYIEGELPAPEEFTYLTVVGSRKFSNYGREACEEIIAGLTGYPVVIISGLALGIDTIAHKSALKAGLKTIGFPGSGLSRLVLHPSSNRRLADEIVASGGALLSELEPEQPAGIHTFPRRNRLMAGMSKGTLIIEAGERSGTLITARLTTEYNRDVYAVPGSIFSPSSYGTNWLIKQGAATITGAKDLLEVLGFKVETEIKNKINLAELTHDEKRVYEILIVEPLPRDELIMALELEPSVANTLLMMLELKGVIKESAGEFRLQ
mgnify:FL=1